MHRLVGVEEECIEFRCAICPCFVCQPVDNEDLVKRGYALLTQAPLPDGGCPCHCGRSIAPERRPRLSVAGTACRATASPPLPRCLIGAGRRPGGV